MSEGAAVLLAALDTVGLEALRPAGEILAAFGVGWTETLATAAEVGLAVGAGVRAVIVASSDAGLPGAFAATTARPVVRVPVPGAGGGGLTLLQDPATNDLPAAGSAPFATVAIGEAGAKNAALFVVSVLALDDPRLWAEWVAFRQRQTDAVLASSLPSVR